LYRSGHAVKHTKTIHSPKPGIKQRQECKMQEESGHREGQLVKRLDKGVDTVIVHALDAWQTDWNP
jgi:hypothetical protein